MKLFSWKGSASDTMLNILVFNYQKAKNVPLRFTDNNFYQPLNLSSLRSELLLSVCTCNKYCTQLSKYCCYPPSLQPRCSFLQFFRRHDSENSVTAAIVTTNDGHEEAGAGHNGSYSDYRPVQMYSTVTNAASSDPAASQQTQV